MEEKTSYFVLKEKAVPDVLREGRKNERQHRRNSSEPGRAPS